MTTHATWPTDRFFWAVLDAPGLKRAGVLPIGLLPMLEEEAPVDAIDLHAVCVPLRDGGLAVCAAEQAALSEVQPATLSLTPESVPPFLEGRVAPERFNLLLGAFEPRPIRARRVKQHAFAAATVLLCGLLVAIGLHRRASRWESLADSARAAAAELAAAHAPTGRPEDLAAEANRLRATRESLAKAVAPPDGALALASVLHAWPASVPSKPQSISVSPAGISVSVSLEGDPAAFLRGFTPPPGWALDEPRLNTAANLTRLSLQLRPMGRTP